MKFGMFFLGEYLHVITISFVTVILFFGGWDLPFVLDQHQEGWIPAIAKLAVISAKVGAMVVFIMWVRWTLPRFRYDTLMDTAWKRMIPLALINVTATACILYTLRDILGYQFY
jgi:NADH-quinone oxidoreductase subunit H